MYLQTQLHVLNGNTMMKGPRGPTSTKIVKGEGPRKSQKHRHMLKMFPNCRICKGFESCGPVVSETKKNPGGRGGSKHLF